MRQELILKIRGLFIYYATPFVMHSITSSRIETTSHVAVVSAVSHSIHWLPCVPVLPAATDDDSYRP